MGMFSAMPGARSLFSLKPLWRTATPIRITIWLPLNSGHTQRGRKEDGGFQRPALLMAYGDRSEERRLRVRRQSIYRWTLSSHKRKVIRSLQKIGGTLLFT